MSEEVQRRIGEAALQRGYLDADELSEILLALGRQLEREPSLGRDIWIDREWLTPEQLSEILADLPSEPGKRTSHADNDPETEEYAGDTSRMNRETDGWENDREYVDAREAAESQPTEAPAAEESERVRERALARRQEEESDPPTSEEETPSPTETLTEPPADYAGADDSEQSIQSAQSTPFPADNSIETIVREEDEAEGAFEQLESSGAGFHPARTVLRASESDEPINAGERFVLRKELGSGGSGRVVRAYDRLLGRSVAMKILHADTRTEPEALSRFVAEAQATGQLEHPNIVPIYDFGVLPSGDAFYTMREVKGDSLRHVLSALDDGREEYEDEYTLVRLLNILRQVSQAAQYAHVRSVIHRDLKPDNIMLGDFGEVMVMDWGLAQVLESEQPSLNPDSLPEDAEPTTLGTPSYMPPEQARGDLEAVDKTSDIYSLGAILYEILTLHPPFSGDGPLDVMWAVVDSDLQPPSERAPEGRDVPEDLERICLKAMAPDQSNRYEKAREFHDELEAWLEGLKPREAARRVEQGDRAADQYRELLSQIEDFNDKVRHLSSEIDEWEPVEQKRELWEVEDRRDEAEAESARAFCEAVTQYTQALAQDPRNEEANQGLADLYWTRLRRAELRGDFLNTIYFKTLVEQYDPGTYEELLAANADLHVSTEPEGVAVELYEYVEEDRRLVPKTSRELGESPAEVESLDIGSYLLKFYPERCRKIQQPVYIERDRDANVEIQLPESSDFEEGFRYVPGGSYLSGGDPDAFAPRRPERIHVDPFFCQELPVTFREYLQWFNELYEERGEEAMPRAPQTREAEGLLVRYDEDRQKWIPDDVLIEGDARERYPAGEGHEWRLPVIGVRSEDAEAYCRWRSERDGRKYRLPTAHEMEKAGRGVDGRRFPWGNSFDPSFCKMRFSRPDNPPQPEPVGAFEQDRSPYGVRDLAGGVQEWCRRRDETDGHRVTKGGGWGQDKRVCHLASTVEILAAARNARIGFRMVYEPSSDAP